MADIVSVPTSAPGPTQATAAAAHATAVMLLTVLLFILLKTSGMTVPAEVALAVSGLISPLIHYFIIKAGLAPYVLADQAMKQKRPAEPVHPPLEPPHTLIIAPDKPATT